MAAHVVVLIHSRSHDNTCSTQIAQQQSRARVIHYLQRFLARMREGMMRYIRTELETRHARIIPMSQHISVSSLPTPIVHAITPYHTFLTWFTLYLRSACYPGAPFDRVGMCMEVWRVMCEIWMGGTVPTE